MSLLTTSRPMSSREEHALPPRRLRRRWREQAFALAVEGRWREALDLERALVLASHKRGSPREELGDRFRLLRWQLALGRWSDALDQIEPIFARLARRGSSGGAAAGWIFLGRAIAYFHLGWGSRFRRTLALVLKNIRRTRTPGLDRAAEQVLVYYESERRGALLPAWLEAVRSRAGLVPAREGRGLASELDRRLLEAAIAAPDLGLPSPHHPSDLGWSRLPELLLGPPAGAAHVTRADAEPAKGDETGSRAVASLLDLWLTRAEENPRLALPSWLVTWLAARAVECAPEVDADTRRRLHHALAQLSTRQVEIVARAAALEASAEVSLWCLSDRAAGSEAQVHAVVAQARADLGLAAGLLRRLRLDRRADACEARWARLTWPGAPFPARVREAGAPLTTPPTKTRPEARAAVLPFLRSALRDAGFITVDPRTLASLSSLQLLASSALPVLILGESGTGKEVIARAIHRWSRLRGELVPIHCGAIPRELLESELFGHTRGAFTGAVAEKPGLIEAADGGTLFLDEIGEMGAEAQMKLLRVLESGEVRRVGDLKPRTAHVRLVAATHRDLVRAVESGGFRLDLLHRIRGLVVELRPLRERRADIPELAHHFLATLPGAPLRLRDRCLSRLMAQEWPGNVRELRATLLRAAYLAQALGRSEIGPDLLGLDNELDLGDALPAPLPVVEDAILGGSGGTIHLEQVLDDLERRLILRALERNEWNRTRAAESLGGLSRTTLIGKMRRLGIEARGET